MLHCCLLEGSLEHVGDARDFEYAIGYKFLLSTKNLRLHGTWEFNDCDVGPFVVLEHISKTAYCLDLSLFAALRGVHDVFHVLLLCDWLSNGVYTDVHQLKLMARQRAKLLQSRDTMNVTVRFSI